VFVDACLRHQDMQRFALRAPRSRLSRILEVCLSGRALDDGVDDGQRRDRGKRGTESAGT
jgi:hypothetical protein